MKNFIQIFSVFILLFTTLSDLSAQSNPAWQRAHRKINFSSRERQVNDTPHSNFRNNLYQDNKLSNTNFRYSQDLKNRGIKENKLFYSDNSTWEKLFPYTTIGWDEEGVDICETTDGSIIMVGNIEYYYNKIIKSNIFGDTVWTKKFLIDDSIASVSTGCIGTENGTFVVTGYYGLNYGHAIYLLKFDASGAIIWEKKYNNLYTIYSDNYYIQKTPDNGFLIYGSEFILKTDSLGNEQWNNNFNTIVIDISKPSGNYYYMLGYNNTVPPTYYISKIDINGNLFWQKQIFSQFTDYIRQKIQILSNKLVLWGNKREYIMPPDIYITTYFIEKADTSGNIFKIDTIPTYRGEDSELKCFDVINDNRYLFSSLTHFGTPPNQCVIRMIDSNANLLRSQTITSEQNYGYKIIESIYLSSLGNYILYGGIGCINMFGGTSCFYGIRTDTNLFINTVGISKQESDIPDSYKLFQNYPNPFNPTTQIKYEISKSSNVILKVYNILGKEISTLINRRQNSGKYQITFDANNLPSGIYFYELTINNTSRIVKKMILIK